MGWEALGDGMDDLIGGSFDDLSRTHSNSAGFIVMDLKHTVMPRPKKAL